MASHPKNQLTAISAKAKGQGRHLDGDGLYLVVDPGGARRWVLRIVVRGQRLDIGLGGFGKVSLAAARSKAAAMREIVGTGGDPLAARRAEAAQKQTFETFATAYIKDHRSEWKNEKHAAQWTSTLRTHVYPVFGSRAIGDVDTPDVVAALRPIWQKTPETASRLRARIETILDAAKAKRLRTGDNPAVWAGGLQASLPRDKRKQRIVHHPALPYRDIAAFLVNLKVQDGTAAHALRFTILTAARTNEVIGAHWSEIDLEARLWIVPKDRMKASKEHRVPLSPETVALLESVSSTKGLIFPGRKADAQMSNMAMLALLKRMDRDDITVHGFRSTFRDWAGEQTHHPREVIEHALAHQLADESEAAYQRGDLLTKRRALMDDWARYCATERSVNNVTSNLTKSVAA